MKWYIDIHKYPSEDTRRLLQIMKAHSISKDSAPEEIADAEREMDDLGLYSGSKGASGRIRRALFTYFTAHNCLDSNGELTQFGNAFEDGSITLKEYAFHYVSTFYVGGGEMWYHPLHLMLLFLQKVRNIDPTKVYLTAFDFKTFQSFDSIGDCNDTFVRSHLEKDRDVSLTDEYRSINFDGWRNLLITSGLFKKDGEKLIPCAESFIYDWLLFAYKYSHKPEKGLISTGVFDLLPMNGYDRILGAAYNSRNNNPQDYVSFNFEDEKTQEENRAEDGAEEEDTLSKFALLVINACYAEDHLHSLLAKATSRTYSSHGIDYTGLCFESYNMSNFFLRGNDSTMNALNGAEQTKRWHDREFTINSDSLYLTTQWRDDEASISTTKPSFDKLASLIRDTYGSIFKLERKITTNADGTPIKKYRLIRLSNAIPSIDSTIMKNFIEALKTKPFLLLAGISGTGKSQKVKELAFLTCPKDGVLNADSTTPGNYCLIEVKPNWHDSTDLLGYYSNLTEKYTITPFLHFVHKAAINPNVPFFVCLDEMNLAPVEQYFAEYLSVLETRTMKDGKIETDELLSKKLFESCSEDGGYTDAELDVLRYLKENGLRLPENLFVIGTVNMDDTTHQFSRKVIDRAFTIEMNGDELEEMFADKNAHVLDYTDTPLPLSELKPKFVKANDALADEVVGIYKDVIIAQVPEKLKAINAILKDTPFRVSYRVQNEFVLYLSTLLLKRKDEDSVDELINKTALVILLEKILPRVQGDEKLLSTADGNVFTDLRNYVKENLKCKDETGVFSEVIAKLDEMDKRLSNTYFANFF